MSLEALAPRLVELPRDAALVIAATRAGAKLALCCEHASARLPEPWHWPVEDEWLRETHWAIDLGAADLTTELAAATGAPAILARFCRLFADANRPESAPDLARARADGRAILLNGELDGAERSRRVAYWRAYHAAFDAMLSASAAEVVLAVHTFTPTYEGSPRTVEVGILFDEEIALAGRLAALLRASDMAGRPLDVRFNEPYSGKQGLMYSVDRHARAHGRRAIEIELRQDLAVEPAFRERFVRLLAGLEWA